LETEDVIESPRWDTERCYHLHTTDNLQQSSVT